MTPAECEAMLQLLREHKLPQVRAMVRADRETPPRVVRDDTGTLYEHDTRRFRSDAEACRMLHERTVALYVRTAERLGCDWAEAGARLLAGVV